MTISTRIHFSQRLLAVPTPPCVVLPPELRVVGTRPAIGRELMARAEPLDRPDLRLEEEGAERADTRNRRELARDGIAPRGTLHVAVKLSDLRRQLIVYAEQPIRLRAQGRRERRGGEPRATTGAVEIGLRHREVLCREVPVDPIPHAGALAHEKRATAEELAALAGLSVRDPDAR